VLDSTHAGIPGATVTVTNTGTNAKRVATTDEDGRFSVPNLPPATYQIRVELAGFQTADVKAFTLRNGEIARPLITLALANVAENVTVIGESPLLQTSSASVSQTISRKQIEDVPINGRTLLSLAALSAGVTPQAFTRGTQFGAAGSSRNQYVTVEGGRDSSTNYTVDGVYVRSLRRTRCLHSARTKGSERRKVCHFSPPFPVRSSWRAISRSCRRPLSIR
jgi:hypothetical protein